MKHDETYSREDLDRLIDYIIEFDRDDVGFKQYAIKGIYVSPEVIDQALNERLERMSGMK